MKAVNIRKMVGRRLESIQTRQGGCEAGSKMDICMQRLDIYHPLLASDATKREVSGDEGDEHNEDGGKTTK